MREDVVNSFLASFQEGVCPLCGSDDTEAVDSDEGATTDHWFERYYTCNGCGHDFTEEAREAPGFSHGEESAFSIDFSCNT